MLKNKTESLVSCRLMSKPGPFLGSKAGNKHELFLTAFKIMGAGLRVDKICFYVGPCRQYIGPSEDSFSAFLSLF